MDLRRREDSRGAARARVGALGSLRELNRLKVLEAVRERGTVTRAQIAQMTGLA